MTSDKKLTKLIEYEPDKTKNHPINYTLQE
jgi:hypothetical protein